MSFNTLFKIVNRTVFDFIFHIKDRFCYGQQYKLGNNKPIGLLHDFIIKKFNIDFTSSQ